MYDTFDCNSQSARKEDNQLNLTCCADGWGRLATLKVLILLLISSRIQLVDTLYMHYLGFFPRAEQHRIIH